MHFNQNIKKNSLKIQVRNFLAQIDLQLCNIKINLMISVVMMCEKVNKHRRKQLTMEDKMPLSTAGVERVSKTRPYSLNRKSCGKNF